MNKLVKRWPIVLTVIVAAAAIVFALARNRGQSGAAQSLAQVFTVLRGDLVASVSPTGEVYAPLQAELAFDVTRTRLIELNVSAGQQVKAGQVLARIETTALADAVVQAEATLTTALDNLEKARTPYSELDLSQARLAVEQAKSSLEDARVKLKEAELPPTKLALAQARLAVYQARIDLEDAKEEQEKAESPSTKLEIDEARLAVTQAETTLHEAEVALESVLKPDLSAAKTAVQNATVALESAKNQLAVAENSSENAAKLRTLEYEAEWYKNNYWAAQDKFSRNEIDQQKLNWEYSNMLAAEERLRVARVQAETSLTSARTKVTDAEGALQQARANLAELQSGPTELDVALAESRVAKAGATLEQARESLAKIESGPDAMDLVRMEVLVSQAEYNLASAEANLTTLEAGADPLKIAKAQLDLQQAEYNLTKAQEKLAELEAGPDPKAIEVAAAQVVKAEAAVKDAQAALDSGTMVAPFGGTVVSVGAVVDQLVSSNTVVVTLADLSNLRVRTTVSEIDITKVKIGQLAEITFDALPGRRFWGEVLEVPLQGQLAQSILTYAVPISLEGAAGADLRPGMTANTKIVIGRRENAMLIPALAVQQTEDGYLVLKQDAANRSETATEVQVGLSDGVYVEVLEGLREGDNILVRYEQPTATGTGFGGTGGIGSIGGAGQLTGGSVVTRPGR